jgi:hypothetical protein
METSLGEFTAEELLRQLERPERGRAMIEASRLELLAE